MLGGCGSAGLGRVQRQFHIYVSQSGSGGGRRSAGWPCAAPAAVRLCRAAGETAACTTRAFDAIPEGQETGKRTAVKAVSVCTGSARHHGTWYHQEKKIITTVHDPALI